MRSMRLPIRFSTPLSFRQLLVILIGIAFFGVQPQTTVYSSTPSQTEKVPRFEERKCSNVFPLTWWEDVDQERFRCGFLVTWENYDTQNRTIWLSVMQTYPNGYFPRRREPIIWLVGGPGSSGFDDRPARTLEFVDIFGRGWIQFSQRGSYLSQSELQCPAYHEAIISNWDQPSEKKPLDWKEWSSVKSTALLDCFQDFEREHGADYLANINSEFSALDVIYLIRTLGYGNGHVNLYGGSYGTLLAQHVLALSPGDVHSVVLAGVGPLGVDWEAEYPRNMRKSLQLIFDACNASSKCRETYPNLEHTFFVLLDQLQDQPLCMPVKDKNETFSNVCLDDYGFLLAIGNMLYKTENIKKIPRIIYGSWNRDLTQISELGENYYMEERNDDFSWGMYFSIYCSEFAGFGSPRVDSAQLEEQFQTIYTASEQLVNDVCQRYDKNENSYGDIEIENANVPILIFSGKFDPATPMQYGQQVADTLSIDDGFQFTSERSAHDPINSQCAVDIMNDFFKNPQKAPASNCWEDENEPIEFELTAGPPSDLLDYDSKIVTYPEYLVLGPGEVGTITIDIQNTGFLAWSAGGEFALVNTNEQTLGADPVQLLSGEIPPGYISRWTISLRAPSQTGLYWTAWQMTNLGEPFGPEVTGLVIVTPDSETDLNPSLLFREWLDGLLSDLQRKFSEWLRSEIERQVQELLESLQEQLCGGSLLMPATILLGTWVVRRKKRYPGNDN